MKNTFSLQRVAALFFLSLGLAGGAFAHPGRDAPGKLEQDGGRESRSVFRGFGRLRDDLKLDAKQETLWKEAMDARKESGKAMREYSRKHREEIKALLDQPNADARAILKRMDEFRDRFQKFHLEERERLLKVYDTLSTEQKEKVRNFFKDRYDHKRTIKHHGRRGKVSDRQDGKASRKD
ncbi:MAG: periplasmic heavy metal sensor [Candidatus Accumulibacter sp.]|jgi:Spy/CpxP family protein refolding chaperone|nr:periplasmic heavy metal sensor [Accumulibacter sp.]